MTGASGAAARALGPVLIPAAAIRRRVEALASEIHADHADGRLHLLVTLKGAWMFAADLVRALPAEVAVEFVRAASYGGGTASAGDVELRGVRQLDLAGASVVVVEDIVDSGRTAHALLAGLAQSGARSVRLATLLSKPSRREVEVPLDYVGFEVPNAFVVGYGMDCGETYRSLPDIHTLDATVPAVALQGGAPAGAPANSG